MNCTADERALIAAAQTGDERAFRELVEPYRRALEVHCYRMLGSIHDAEDIVQETLLRAWSALERFERRSSVQTWLYRIATNACLDELERRPRRPQPAIDPYPDDRIPESEGPAGRYAQREGREIAFLTAIQRLPGRQRAVLILRDVLGWTADEVADLLDSTGAAVNSALQRARATIEGEQRAVAPGATQRDLLRRYVDAWEQADIDGLIELLREDAVLTMPPEPSVHGAAAIREFFARVHPGGPPSAAWATGRPAVLLRNHRLLVLDIEDDRIVAIHAFADPAVLAAFAA
jgi:RNA polymerase sigma-70 factor (ECF subfamily)